MLSQSAPSAASSQSPHPPMEFTLSRPLSGPSSTSKGSAYRQPIPFPAHAATSTSHELTSKGGAFIKPTQNARITRGTSSTTDISAYLHITLLRSTHRRAHQPSPHHSWCHHQAHSLSGHTCSLCSSTKPTLSVAPYLLLQQQLQCRLSPWHPAYSSSSSIYKSTFPVATAALPPVSARPLLPVQPAPQQQHH